MSLFIAPSRTFADHGSTITAVAVFPDRRHMVTGSEDKILRLWDMRQGVVLKKMEGHRTSVKTLALSEDGRLIASGDQNGDLFAWHGETGESLTQTVQAHSNWIWSLHFSPDGAVLASGSSDATTKLWSTKTWQLQGDPIHCGLGGYVRCIRYSPSGEYLAIATAKDIQIRNPATRECVANLEGHNNYSLAWTPDSACLISGEVGSNLREWDSSTWKQVGNPWKGHTQHINAISIHPTGTLAASASTDNHVRLWRLLDRRTIAIFQHSASVTCITFSMDGKHILSGGVDKKISEWAIPVDALPNDAPKEPVSNAQGFDSKILAISTIVRHACIAGDLSTAEELLTQEIHADANNHTSYANRSFVMARKLDWDHALEDATKSISIQPSMIGYISKGISLCGKEQVLNAMKTFDLAFTFTNADPKTTHLLFLIKAIALFNLNNDEEAMLPVQQLAARHNADPLACRVVEAYLRVQLGKIAMNGELHEEAAGHFAAAVNASVLFSQLDVHSMYEEFVVLFGWDLKSLWQTANQQRCRALLRAAQFGAALESYRYMMDMSDEPTKAIFLAWIPALNE